MSKSQAQFWVAVLSVVSLTVITCVSVVLDYMNSARGELTMILVGGIISITSGSTAWLFRSNGPNGGPKSQSDLKVG